MEAILRSPEFSSARAYRAKVKSPTELVVGAIRQLGARTAFRDLAVPMARMGQELFNPPNVKGWDGGRAWINSSTLLGRANFVRQLLTAKETRFDAGGGGSLESLARRAGATTPEQTVDWLLELLVAVPVPAAARDALVQLAGGGGETPAVIHAISALPEFQLA